MKTKKEVAIEKESSFKPESEKESSVDESSLLASEESPVKRSWPRKSNPKNKWSD